MAVISHPAEAVTAGLNTGELVTLCISWDLEYPGTSFILKVAFAVIITHTALGYYIKLHKVIFVLISFLAGVGCNNYFLNFNQETWLYI